MVMRCGSADWPASTTFCNLVSSSSVQGGTALKGTRATSLGISRNGIGPGRERVRHKPPACGCAPAPGRSPPPPVPNCLSAGGQARLGRLVYCRSCNSSRTHPPPLPAAHVRDWWRTPGCARVRRGLRRGAHDAAARAAISAPSPACAGSPIGNGRPASMATVCWCSTAS